MTDVSRKHKICAQQVKGLDLRTDAIVEALLSISEELRTANLIAFRSSSLADTVYHEIADRLGIVLPGHLEDLPF